MNIYLQCFYNTFRADCLAYQDYPVVEWVVWLENRGGQSSLLIQDLLALDGDFAGSAPRLYHCNGDFYSVDGYTSRVTLLRPGDVLEQAPNVGRPCDGAFPYFRVQFEGRGLTLAVGWPGQWAASFAGVENGVQITAGEEQTCLRLLPGEKIRTPRMTALAWVGDSASAVNLWRRWYLDHILPRPDGRPLQVKLACAATDTGEEFISATEENQIRYMDKFQQRGIDFDVWWIDAGWYPCRDENGDRRWWRTGTWTLDPDRFPEGFRNVSKNAARHGAGLLIWFEPERVYAGSQLDLEHPEWLVQALRLKDCPEEFFTAFPMVTAPGAEYVFENPETGQSIQIAGSALSEKGLTFTLPKRSAGIRFYRIDSGAKYTPGFTHVIRD